MPPTSHPLDLVERLDEDEPHESLALDDVFANAPAIARATSSACRRVAPVVDTLRLTAEEAMGLVERRELSAAELHAAYLDGDRRAGRRAPLLPAHGRRADGNGIPIALKDVISTKGVETTAGSRILAGYVPVFDSTVAAR